ncbi:MAG TPA: glycosyltransferase [Mycobacteriales bacterium]|nr:glycosyltransferase [Mycobacteriales bacterium]
MAERKVLLAASTGGHLAQLHRFAPLLGASADSLWVTFETNQSRSLLEGRRVCFLPYVGPRQSRPLLRTIPRIRELLRNEHFDVAASTGAGIALTTLPLARAHGVPALYIESLSRVNGPSLSGRVLAASHTVQLRTQHPAWATRRWRPFPSVLDTYHRDDRPEVSRPKLFVTLGTIKPYRFDALVDAVLATGLADERTVWQLGETTRSDLPGTAYQMVSRDQFNSFATEADVVVAHAGVGTLLDLLELGVSPLVVPRRRSRNEHVDDHQVEICELMARHGLVAYHEAPDLSGQAIVAASGRGVLAEPVSPQEVHLSEEQIFG